MKAIIVLLFRDYFTKEFDMERRDQIWLAMLKTGFPLYFVKPEPLRNLSIGKSELQSERSAAVLT